MQHQSASESLDSMIKDVLKGGRVDGAGIAGMTANFLSDLTSDTDSLMNVAFEAGSDAALADDSLKTSMYGMAIGLEMGLDAENIRKIGLIGIVQNWGMVRVPKAVRYSQRSLTDKEFLEIKRHPIYTLEMLEKVSGFSAIVPLVAYQMHEQINGRGYPRGRSGRSIHLFARILQVADAYVAMTSARPHREALMPYVAMSSLLGYTKIRKFDADVVRAFLLAMSLFPIGSAVVLEDSRVGLVYRRNGNNYNQPIVKVLQNPDGTLADAADPNSIVDLAEANLQVVQALPTPGRKELTSDTRPAPTCT
jgi:HD-GYP domain-containing protein (c-di-GMP phosphodiesterase class II)